MPQIKFADEPEVLPFDEHHPDFFVREPFYSGEEFSANFAYYAGDDEDTSDQDVFDAHAYACWCDEVNWDD